MGDKTVTNSEVLHNRVSKATLTAKIIRADGTVEDYGVIAGYERKDRKWLFRKVKSFFRV